MAEKISDDPTRIDIRIVDLIQKIQILQWKGSIINPDIDIAEPAEPTAKEIVVSI